MSDIKITFKGIELKKFDGGFFTVDELNTESEIDRIEHAIKYGMRKIAYRNFKEKECMYSEYFTYASKLPESQRFGKSTMILSQALNLLKYKDNIEMFKPLKFNPLLVEI